MQDEEQGPEVVLDPETEVEEEEEPKE